MNLFFLKKKKIFIVATLLIFLSLYSFTYATRGTPSILNYQGRLTDSDGDLLGGTGTAYYFKFSIWDNATVGSGSRVWPISAPATTTATVRSGVFNVDIGEDTPESLDYNFSANQDIYLQVEVSSNNISSETLSPRQRIASAAFAQVAGAVMGVNQSSIGTTTPFSTAVATIEATSTAAIPLVIRGFVSQVADMFRVVTDTGTQLLTFTAGGKLGIGTTTPQRNLSVLDVNSAAQLRLGSASDRYGEFYTDNAGDVKISSTGGNIRQNDENLWVCEAGSCAPDMPADKGNIVLENSLIFDNKFKIKQISNSTTAMIMYSTSSEEILKFDDGQ